MLFEAFQTNRGGMLTVTGPFGMCNITQGARIRTSQKTPFAGPPRGAPRTVGPPSVDAHFWPFFDPFLRLFFDTKNAKKSQNPKSANSSVFDKRGVFCKKTPFFTYFGYGCIFLLHDLITIISNLDAVRGLSDQPRGHVDSYRPFRHV